MRYYSHVNPVYDKDGNLIDDEICVLSEVEAVLYYLPVMINGLKRHIEKYPWETVKEHWSEFLENPYDITLDDFRIVYWAYESFENGLLKTPLNK